MQNTSNDEFEALATPDARYANALDRLQPLLQNVLNDGGTWQQHGIGRAAVLQCMQPTEQHMPEVWPFVLAGMDAVVPRDS